VSNQNTEGKCVVSIGDSSVSNQNTEGKCVVSIGDSSVSNQNTDRCWFVYSH